MPEELAGEALRNSPALWAEVLPQLSASTHKHARGQVFVIAGGVEGVGAPRLAARAALRIGAGLVTIAAPGEAMPAHAARGPDALMLRRAETAADLEALVASARHPALIIGPALGFDVRASAMVQAVVTMPMPLVLDADALTLVARSPSLQAALAARAMPAVLTPHAGEFARLAPELSLAEAIEGGAARARLVAAQSLADRLRAVIVLKGPGTITAAPGGNALINPTGSPALATAGSGDVLAGVIGGLMAQGMPAFEAASAAVYWHGEAGQRLGPGLIADDLPEEIARLRWRP